MSKSPQAALADASGRESDAADSGPLLTLDAMRTFVRTACPRRRVTVVGGHDPAAIEACVNGCREGLIAKATLVGDARATRGIADREGLDTTELELVDVADEAAMIDVALSRFRAGEADVLMKGNVPTGHLLRAVLDKRYGLRTDRILSQVGVFGYQGRLILLSDCGVNVDPGLTRKVDIIRNAVGVARHLGIALPRVAMLAAVETVHLQAMPATCDAIVLKRMNERGELTGCLVEGPLSLDLAIVPRAVRVKGMCNPVAGKADILIADDIEMGNVLYKSIAVMQGLPMASVLAGCRVPVILPSRADTPENKLYSVALSVLLTQDLEPGHAS